jgi:hypothetical protein
MRKAKLINLLLKNGKMKSGKPLSSLKSTENKKIPALTLMFSKK